MELNSNRTLLATLLVAVVCGANAGFAQDPLPSWNDGAAKKAIVEFVQATTTLHTPRLLRGTCGLSTADYKKLFKK
jgi:hypothetical protein